MSMLPSGLGKIPVQSTQPRSTQVVPLSPESFAARIHSVVDQAVSRPSNGGVAVMTSSIVQSRLADAGSALAPAPRASGD